MTRHRNWHVSALVLAIAASLHAVDGPKVGGGDQYTPGLSRTMLLLQGEALYRLGPDGITVKEKHNLGGKYTQIAERKDYFVALSAEPKAVVVLDKKTFKPLRKQALQYMGLTDLTLHPKLPVSYVAVKFAIEAPRYRVIVFNEEAGEAHEPRGFFGGEVSVHPAGTFLVTALDDIYERGTRFFINPGWQLHSVPDYGSIDLLITYAIDDKGMPSFIDLKTKAGGNGKGLRMSPDGQRVTYLSHVGTPQFSGNLAGFDPLDLQKLPVNYATKDRATTYELAYHPSLPLCASPSKTSVVFFNRETGEIEERLSAAPGVDQIHRIYFSPDGRQIVLDSDKAGVRALRSAALKLSREELVNVSKPVDYGVEDNSAKVITAMKRARRENDEKLDPAKASRDKSVDWLKLQNTFGPDHKIVVDQTKVIEAELAAGRNFFMVFGKGLMKSGTTTYMCIWNGTFFALPLTQQQDAAIEFPKFTLVKAPGGKSGWRLIEPKAQMSELKVTDADKVDGSKNLTGTVKLERLDDEKGYYALKLSTVVGETSKSSFHHLGEYLTEKEIKFSFPPLVGKDGNYKGALPVFIELVAFATADRRTEAAIASNTIAQIVIVKGSD
ncbi:MAG: hypothetical protein WD768_06925 [Phycisphaeraceae bacterium]